MLRVAMTVLFSTIGCLCLMGDDEPKPQPPDKIPDASWRPKAGDQVAVYQIDAPSVAVLPNFDAMAKCREAADQLGMEDLLKRKVVVMIPTGTPVLVIESRGLPPLPQYDYRPVSSEEARREIQDSIMRSFNKPKSRVSIEVRILDGPMKGQARIVCMESLAKLVDKKPEPIQAVPGGKYRIGTEGADAVKEWTKLQRDFMKQGKPIREVVAFTMAPGTRVVVLKESNPNPIGAVLIRVSGGQKNAGKTGYVRAECLTRNESTEK